MLSVQGSPGGEGGSLGDKTQLTTATGQLVCAGHRARGWVSTDAPGVSMDMGWEAWTAVTLSRWWCERGDNNPRLQEQR